MATYFCDTSALVKRYVAEVGSAWLTETIHPHVNARVYIAQVTKVEITSALTRRAKRSSITPQEAKSALDQFFQDWKTEITIIDLSANIVDEAVNLAREYSLRGYDAVQLATALDVHRERSRLNLSRVTLLSADNELNAAAVKEGLKVENPSEYE